MVEVCAVYRMGMGMSQEWGVRGWGCGMGVIVGGRGEGGLP